jgi:hypothetical protein
VKKERLEGKQGELSKKKGRSKKSKGKQSRGEINFNFSPLNIRPLTSRSPSEITPPAGNRVMRILVVCGWLDWDGMIFGI